tara:strand:- start:1324 stop:1917 length:594 start_codon:yes stop_codon:yes gene_type:complete
MHRYPIDFTSSNNFIHIFKDRLSPAKCEEIISFMESKKENWIDNDDPGRKDWNIFLEEYASGEQLLEYIKLDLKECYKELQELYEIGGAFEINMDKAVKIQKAVPGGGFTQWHTEQGNSPSTSKRFMVWMYYLNDCDSGYTEFKFTGDRTKPEQGKLVLWPAAYTHMHRAAPDLKEDKYILTGWFSASEKRVTNNEH